MTNPWMKKNPLLSMWLSGANMVAGSMRGRMIAESQKLAATMMAQGYKQAIDFWTGGWMKPPTRKTK